MINLDLEAKRFNQTCNHQNLATSISGNPFSIFRFERSCETIKSSLSSWYCKSSGWKSLTDGVRQKMYMSFIVCACVCVCVRQHLLCDTWSFLSGLQPSHKIKQNALGKTTYICAGTTMYHR